MGPDGKTPRHRGSGKDLSYFDEEAFERDKAGLGLRSFKEYLEKRKGEPNPGYPYQYVPHVIEPSAGADRATLAFLCEAYKDGMPEVAQKLYRELKREFTVFYDDKGAVGRRDRRQDEAGTPYSFTIDGQTLQDNTVTIRDRDTLKQERLPVTEVADRLHELLRPRGE
jgi:glycyl-tRNA synthetase